MDRQAPRPASTRMIDLCSGWRIATDPDNAGIAQEWFRAPRPDARPIRVPGILQEVFPAYHGVVWYWREFESPANPITGGRTLLRFHAVDYLARVWVNGVEVGGHEGGETPFELDITDAVRHDAANVLAVRVLNPTNEPIDGITLKQTPHRNKSIPHYVGGGYNYGGIIEPVELLLVPPARIADVFVRADAATGRVRAQVTIRNPYKRARFLRVWLGVRPAGGEGAIVECQTDYNARPGDSVVELTVAVPEHRLWELADPVLYRAELRLTHRPDWRDERAVRFGFRDLRVVDGFFHLNGRRIFLKSTHTGNHCPVGQVVPPSGAPDVLRMDLLYAKASGFNMVRFIAGVAHPWQLDLCDEFGLMVYEESLAGWCLEDSPEMTERFDRSVREIVLRDRNHACVTIWGLLNETQDGPVFQHAAASLPLVRALDVTRLVLLGSGRWDNHLEIGSVCNPGGSAWELTWGAEREGYDEPFVWGCGGYVIGAGDAHMYPSVPQTVETDHMIRTAGADGRPVFLSEYGIGSVMNVIREARTYEQHGVPADIEDYELVRSMADRFLADWSRFGFDGVYAFPEDMLLESQRLHCRQRTLGFDLIRSNPRICGFNLTGMLDHGMTGEGLWTFWREWKPGIADALRDGWAPLRWCLFASPLHAYAGRTVRVEAVLANEGVLTPGDYPAAFRLLAPDGVAWEQKATVTIPPDDPLAVPVLDAEVTLRGAPGAWVFAADLGAGGSPAGARLRFHVSEEAGAIEPVETSVVGIEPEARAWLERHGVLCRPFAPDDPAGVILAGQIADDAAGAEMRRALMRRVAKGCVAVFLSPAAFRRGEDATGWLPLAERGRCYDFSDWLYHKECVSNRHTAFAGLPGPGVMDWDYYGPLISHTLFDGQPAPDETIVAAFALGHSIDRRGYASGVMMGAYRFGAGRFVVNTLHILPNVGRRPAADRLLLNLIRYAADAPREAVPPDIDALVDGLLPS